MDLKIYKYGVSVIGCKGVDSTDDVVNRKGKMFYIVPVGESKRQPCIINKKL